MTLISTPTLWLLLDGSSLLTDAENIGDAGNVNITASENVVLSGEGISAAPGAAATDLVPSQISTTVEAQAVGNGGSIDIATSSLSARENAFISATAFGQGTAGIIDISAGSIELEKWCRNFSRN